MKVEGVIEVEVVEVVEVEVMKMKVMEVMDMKVAEGVEMEVVEVMEVKTVKGMKLVEMMKVEMVEMVCKCIYMFTHAYTCAQIYIFRKRTIKEWLRLQLELMESGPHKESKSMIERSCPGSGW